MTKKEIENEIVAHMPLEEFLQIQKRLAFLRNEEELKLKALAELQKAYLSANTEQQQDMVKGAVAQIREISRKTREEIKALNSKIYERMPLAEAKDLYERYIKLQPQRRRETEE